MPIKYLNITAEEAVLVLSRLIEEGYEIKIGFDSEYRRVKKEKGGINNSSINELVAHWKNKADAWFNKTISELGKIYTTKRMAYEFQEAQPGIGFHNEADNLEWFSTSRSLGAKLDKLNQFDDFIKREFRVEIEYVAGDKYETHGKNSPITNK